jgi:uncharacterized membrane protein YtjA (UPF0391 family)
MLGWQIAFMIVTILATALVITGMALSFIGAAHVMLFAAVAVAIFAPNVTQRIQAHS